MIELKKKGDLLKENVDAIVNTVNCVGIMGKGIALQFKMAYPANFKEYKKACDTNEIKIGKMFVTEQPDLFKNKLIINFPTKNHWRGKSKIDYIENGLDDLKSVIQQYNITSIAIPPLGCGLGGLDWNTVKDTIFNKLGDLDHIHIILYEPSQSPKAEHLKIRTEKPSMTIGRALLIALLKNYIKAGYRNSPLEVQKLMYFLQESGVNLKLQYEKAQYGPYANNLNHVLQAMEGHFITGYGDGTNIKDINLLPEGISEANDFIADCSEEMQKLKTVIELIEGFETPYGLELLSTVHWTIKKEHITETENMINFIQDWTPRKKMLFNENHIKIAKNRLTEKHFV